MKKIFKIDCGLYPLGFCTILTGIGLHIAGHGNCHHIWEIWAAVHTVTGVSFLVLLIYHIRTHWAWFKNLRQSKDRRKRFITTILSVVSILTVLSGIALLAVCGANTHLGLLHYKIGIGFAILILLHGAKRIHIIEKAVFTKHVER
ncbi:MAG: hypothetical protein ACI4BA_08085 [Prevotella sp.]